MEEVHPATVVVPVVVTPVAPDAFLPPPTFSSMNKFHLLCVGTFQYIPHEPFLSLISDLLKLNFIVAGYLPFLPTMFLLMIHY